MVHEGNSGEQLETSGGTSGRLREASTINNKLNREIIQRLQKDGRTPFSDIAQSLGVSEGTIRNRVSAMKDSGQLRIVAITDSGASEYRTEAMIGLRVAAGHRPERVATRLGALDEVVYVVWVSGTYDLLIEVIVDDRKSFLSLVSEHIYKAGDVASIDVMTGLMNFKNQFLLKNNWS